MGHGFLKDGRGNNSSTRLISFSWGLGVLCAWLYVVIYHSALADIPSGVLGVLAIVLGAKVTQSTFAEKNDPQEQRKQ
jgi:hypothetical protein